MTAVGQDDQGTEAEVVAAPRGDDDLAVRGLKGDAPVRGQGSSECNEIVYGPKAKSARFARAVSPRCRRHALELSYVWLRQLANFCSELASMYRETFIQVQTCGVVGITATCLVGSITESRFRRMVHDRKTAVVGFCVRDRQERAEGSAVLAVEHGLRSSASKVEGELHADQRVVRSRDEGIYDGSQRSRPTDTPLHDGYGVHLPRCRL